MWSWRRCAPCWHRVLLQATLKQKEAELEVVAPYSKSYGRTLVRTILESEGGGVTLVRTAVYMGCVDTGTLFVVGRGRD